LGAVKCGYLKPLNGHYSNGKNGAILLLRIGSDGDTINLYQQIDIERPMLILRKISKMVEEFSVVFICSERAPFSLERKDESLYQIL
jgi:hypothetical protein